jgi:ubiquinone/menaquinone biosynthesis C-methylase UbiE/DNA-binding HxlR family transcriptional regulator
MMVMDDMLKALRAAGEPTRLRALALLQRADLSVGELAQLVGQSQPGLSRHMKLLTDSGLVERMPEGAFVYYRLARSGDGRSLAEGLLSLLDAGGADIARDRDRLEAVLAARTEAARAYFDSVAPQWDALRSLHYPNEKIEQVILDMAGPGPFERVVDVGTGTGRMLALLAGKARSAEGIDISHGMLTVARAQLERDGLRHANVRQGDAANLPFEDASADLVIIHQVLHFLGEPRAALAEAARVARPGGRVLIVDFAPHGLEDLRDSHAHRHLGIDPDHLAEWGRASGLAPLPPRRFDPPSDLQDGLSVLVWALDRPHDATRLNHDPTPQEALT